MQAQFNLTVIGQHYFQNETGVLTPIWDLRAEEPFKGNVDAFVATHKVKAIASPDGPSDITWVELDKNSGQNSGQLASTVYRIDTVAGQPAASVSCSVDLVLILFNQRNPFYSVAPEIHQLSSMLQNTVRLHGMIFLHGRH